MDSKATIDVEVPTKLRQTVRLPVTPEWVKWGDHRVVVDRVEHLAWLGTRMSFNLVRVSQHVQCWLADGQDRVEIKVNAGPVKSQQQRLDEASEALGDIVFGSILPRMVDAALQQIRQGATVGIGGTEVLKPVASGGIPGLVKKQLRARNASTVELDSRGVALRGSGAVKASWPWASITGAHLENGEALLATTDRRKPTPLLRLTYVNAILLPDLVQAVLAGS